jgi:SH3-like domain-containing protein
MILGISENGIWAEILVGGRRGWVRTRNITGSVAMYGENDNRAWINSLGPRISRVTQAGQTRRRVVLRRGPGNNFRRATTLANNKELQIVARQGSWSQVRVGNRIGWIPTRKLHVVTPIRRTTPNVTLMFRKPQMEQHMDRAGVTRHDPGTRVRVLAQQGMWSRVRIGSRIGWVRTRNLSR